MTRRLSFFNEGEAPDAPKPPLKKNLRPVKKKKDGGGGLLHKKWGKRGFSI